MPVTNVTHDIDTRTLTITAEFDAPIARIWQIYADPRRLEKGLGPACLPGDVRRPSAQAGRPDELLHDRTRR